MTCQDVFADHSSQSDGDEIRIKDTFYENITEMVTKEIGNNVQTVSHLAIDQNFKCKFKADSSQVSDPHGFRTRQRICALQPDP